MLHWMLDEVKKKISRILKTFHYFDYIPSKYTTTE